MANEHASFTDTNWDLLDTFVPASVQTNWLEALDPSLRQAFFRVTRFW